MCVCRTCLAKGDLQPIFSDRNLVNIRTKQLFTVTGVKITINDGLPQQICTQCSHLIMGALKLREISTKSNKILQNKLKCNTKYKDAQMSKEKDDIAISDTPQMNIKQISKRKDLKIKTEKRKIVVGNLDSVRIEDFESSDESQSMNQIYLEDLDSDVDEPKISIEDFESSDSFDGEDIEAVVEMLQEHSRNNHGYQEMRDKQLLERQRRRTETQKLDHKLLSLAVSPYDPGGPIRCSLCSTVVKSVPNFKNHAKIHYELKNACEECGKKFLTPSLVRYHQQRVHGRPKRLACTQCAYRAVDSQQLQNHERATHTGERPFSCDVCGDAFRMRRNIVQHMRKHFGVRNLQCERCPAMFRSRSELSGHQSKVHDHVFSYPCYLCPDTYKRPASVRKHLLNAHGVPSHQQLTVKCVKTLRRSCDKSD